MLKKMTLAIASLMLATTVNAAEITGAGATFPYPVYSKWANDYKSATGNTINYQSIGSGAGIKQIQAKTVTFGASDMPLDQKDLDKDGLVQFPTVIGGNVIAFNVEGIKANELVLSGDVVADIFLGKIKKWDDLRIARMNPYLKLPSQSITVVRRSDGSGTTYVFSKYLSSVSKEWNDTVGTGTALEWPVGVGAKGNDGVASNITQTNNSIGYVEYAYAKQNKLGYAALSINDKIIEASKNSFQDNSWPITAPTYIIMYKQPADKVASKEALNFFNWSYSNGAVSADALDYVPLSEKMINEIKTTVWSQIQN
jgi:phosphate transport system substrate-binding protein